MPTPVSLYLITFNEAQNLREVLPTVLRADEVVVVNSFSTDGTITAFDTNNGHRLCHLYNLLIHRQPGKLRRRP
jgi:glycosyltransferase involved in cell wall biosynthesis